MATLLDANVLVSLLVPEHVHHDAAESWFVDRAGPFATCPSTEGSLLRFLIREDRSASEAKAVLTAVAEDPRHEFWPDQLSYQDVSLEGVIGHRQVTDAYLAQLARARQGRLATFDHGFAELQADVAHLVPSRAS